MNIAGGILPFLALTQWQQRVFVSPLEDLTFVLAHTGLVVAYFGVTEAVWSASLGKMVVGLRVVRPGRQPLGVGRSLARALLWSLSLTPGTIVWFVLWPFDSGVSAWSAGWWSAFLGRIPRFIGFGILFSRARRANGFAGLHDLATQTRVVSKLPFEPTPARTSGLEAPVPSPAPTRLGPYVMVDERAASGAVVGFDQQLARRVWIRRCRRAHRPCLSREGTSPTDAPPLVGRQSGHRRRLGCVRGGRG